jgi:hypothetical protein
VAYSVHTHKIALLTCAICKGDPTMVAVIRNDTLCLSSIFKDSFWGIVSPRVRHLHTARDFKLSKTTYRLRDEPLYFAAIGSNLATHWSHRKAYNFVLATIAIAFFAAGIRNFFNRIYFLFKRGERMPPFP